MSRLQERKLLVPFLSAILAASTLAAGAAGVLAASSSRNVFYGSPGTTAPGSLTFTTAFAGGATATDVVFRNNGPQTLNHIRLSGGAQVPTTVNAGSPPPTGPSLPADLDYLALYPCPHSPTPPSCLLTNQSAGGFDGFVYDVGQLGAGQSVQFRLVVSAPTAAAARGLWLSAQFNEGSSGTGSNPDVAFTSGSFSSSLAGCAGVANYFLVGQKVNLTNESTGTCPTQKALIKGPSFDGQGAFASLALNLSSTQCAAGVTCFGGLVVASVNGGAPGTDAIEWTIRWASSLYSGKPKGVLHFLDSGGIDIINFKPASECATAAGLHTGTNCWFGLVSTRDYTEVSFRTATNGSARGF